MCQSENARLRDGGVKTMTYIVVVCTHVFIEGYLIRIMDGEMQRDGTVAAMNGLEVFGVVAGLCISSIRPSVGDTGGVPESVSGGRIDGQMQGDGAVTPIDILEYLGIIASLIVDGVVPLIAVASGGREL